MNLINIGEGASRILRLHSDVAASYPQILWQEMIGMRNRIAHGYNDIDMDVVWDTANGALLDFIAAVEPDVTRFIAEFDARTSNSSNGDS